MVHGKMCRIILIFVSELPEFLLAFPPVRVHLDKQAEEHLLLEEVLHLDPRLCSDCLERLAALADDDSFLRIAHHIDHGADVISLRTFLDLPAAAASSP